MTDPMGDNPIDLPEWLATWPPIIAAVRKIETMPDYPGHTDILRRLATDLRMKDVWAELSNRDRKTGAYIHPAAVQDGSPHKTPDEAHAHALGVTLFQAFLSTVDKRAAGKLEPVIQARQRLLSEAEMLRGLADELRRSVAAAPAYILAKQSLDQEKSDVDALLRVAVWRENLAAEMRGSDDPLTIHHDRGDPLVRGVATDMASLFAWIFGNHLYGLAAKIAGVATGGTITASAVRAAFPAKS
jgi:hypothetical protein